MSTKTPEKTHEWMKISKFIIFCISCVAAVVIWLFAQQDKTSYEISQNYVSKYELRLLEREVEILRLELRDFKSSFNSKLDKMESSNDAILNLITDIRLTLAGSDND